MDFVIIGGDAAGMSAASRSKRNNPDLNVTVLEQTMDVSYSACNIPYNIADPKRSIDDLVVRSADVFRNKQGIRLLTGHCVHGIDPDGKTVYGKKTDGAAFSFPYDKLLIATGASPVKPDLPGFDLPGVMAIKSLDDGRRIKQFLVERSVKNTVIIGMGYIALEMAEALCIRGIEVSMIKPRPVLLPWLHPDAAKLVEMELKKNGVKLFSGHRISRIEKKGETLHVVSDKVTLSADMVLVAVGVRPNIEPALNAGLLMGPHSAIAVDDHLRTSDINIYAAGDCADAFHVVTGERTWVPLALRANRAGWAVADSVCGKDGSVPPIAGTAVFKVFDFEVARTGLTLEESKAAGFEPAQVMIKSGTRAHIYPGSEDIWVHMIGDRVSGRLLGVQMIGRESAAWRINAAAVALQVKMTVEQFSHCDLAYAPPFGPVWDPMLMAANQLLKKM